MKKVKRNLIMIAAVLSLYVSIGEVFPQLRSRENIIVMEYIK